MITTWIVIIVGFVALVFGTTFGLILSGLCLVASKADQHIDEVQQPQITVEDLRP